MNGLAAVMTKQATIHALWAGEYEGRELIGLFTSSPVADRAELQAWRDGKEHVKQEHLSFDGQPEPGDAVYLVWSGVYADRTLVGVYATKNEADVVELATWREGADAVEIEDWGLDVTDEV